MRCGWNEWNPFQRRSAGWNTLVFDTTSARGPLGRNDLLVAVEVDEPDRPHVANRNAQRGTTLVPMIPAGVRNQVRFYDRDVFVLWEVEKWDLIPPRDPLLLRHLHGDAYAVLAAWDLTPLERMVMAGRRNRA